MVLVFGGTTEGRKAVEVLEEGGGHERNHLMEDPHPTYYYSTKTGEQDIVLHHGRRIDGAMDGEAMMTFCRAHDIRLIVDAAHPFASTLHKTIADVAASLQIPVIRYERIYPPRDTDITWIDDYSQVPTDIHSLLATTGVQSIGKLKWLEERGVKVFYRILNRESSIALAKAQEATNEQLCFYELKEHGDGSPDRNKAGGQKSHPEDSADAILLKESGRSGGFVEKVAEAREKGMRIIALKRPSLSFANTVNGPYGLRRAIEKLLPAFFPLHSGLTTGTCATAAAIAATLSSLTSHLPHEVPVILPNGETITVPVGYADGYAYCIKEAGDDPDVTNGIEVRATCSVRCPADAASTPIIIEGGEGVGRFTLPGFDYPPGEAAINKGPREMIRQNIAHLLAELSITNEPLSITITVPHGEEIARRTFNPRLGIEGGISIIGVSGIVKPFSEEAFIDSIRKCVEVAIASGTNRIVINSGGKSERFVKALYPELPQQAFVEYGNYIGETLSIIADLSPLNVTLGVMLGKAVKLANGQLDTHSRKSTMDKTFIAQLLREANCPAIDLSTITLARELWERLPATCLPAFARVIISHCAEHCRPLLPNGELTILLIDDEGHIYS